MEFICQEQNEYGSAGGFPAWPRYEHKIRESHDVLFMSEVL